MTNAEAPRLSMRQRRITGLVIYNALMVLLCLVIIYPLIWTIFSSFKTNQQIFSESPINLIPRPFTTGNYQKLLTIYDVPLMVFNGLYLAIVIPVLSMLTSSMAAYALARLRFRGRNVIFLLLISTMMIPGYVTLIPNFAIMVKLKLLNSHWALILRSALSGSATSIFLFRQFFLSIPRDLENAAIVDGCSWPGVFFRIIMPNSKPAIATVIILSFRSTWNSFLWPQLVLQTDRLWTWTLALKILSESETNQAVLLAGSVISILPILIIYLACQKYFVNSQVSAGFGGT
ncbi:MAG: carbohydrate ABC transporter permease [Clostridiales bacterium]|nr:carbohydrate ABC transporter permease [Clostridiales bacterium]MDD7123036.1 carbohydrate ABC transporter permease [Clostridiales bacterium]MDY5468904.1 carbohydrate ABC transporter permease [Eubacteriales bacterium]